MFRSFTVKPNDRYEIENIGEILNNTLEELMNNKWVINNIIPMNIEMFIDGKSFNTIQFIILAEKKYEMRWK